MINYNSYCDDCPLFLTISLYIPIDYFFVLAGNRPICWALHLKHHLRSCILDGTLEYISSSITVLSLLIFNVRLAFINLSIEGFLPLYVDIYVHSEKVVQHVLDWYACKIQANGINEPHRIEPQAMSSGKLYNVPPFPLTVAAIYLVLKFKSNYYTKWTAFGQQQS